MKCKILTDFGYYFVCMPDGRKIPLLVSVKIEQTHESRGAANVTFRAIIDKYTSGPRIEIINDKPNLEGVEIPGVASFNILPPITKDANEEIEVHLVCTVCETADRPHPLRLI